MFRTFEADSPWKKLFLPLQLSYLSLASVSTHFFFFIFFLAVNNLRHTLCFILQAFLCCSYFILVIYYFTTYLHVLNLETCTQRRTHAACRAGRIGAVLPFILRTLQLMQTRCACAYVGVKAPVSWACLVSNRPTDTDRRWARMKARTDSEISQQALLLASFRQNNQQNTHQSSFSAHKNRKKPHRPTSLQHQSVTIYLFFFFSQADTAFFSFLFFFFVKGIQILQMFSVLSAQVEM